MNKNSSTRKCAYKYLDGKTCNRPLTRGIKDKEGEQYCIFHARNDEKLKELKEQMEIEISSATESFRKDIKAQNLSEDNKNHKAKIAEIRSTHKLNFEGVYIPNGLDLLKNYLFHVDIVFKRGIFNGIMNFNGVHFEGNVDFSFTFFNKVIFRSGVTIGELDFQSTVFMGEVNFANATFRMETNFSDTIFNGDANFRQTKFDEDLHFFDGKFEKRASFDKATFNKKAIFSDVIFYDKADFTLATFSSDLQFQEAVFNQDVNFFKSIFAGNVEFAGAIFIDNAFFTFINLIDEAKLKFRNIIFFSTGAFQDISEGSNISFINCNFFRVSFLRSRISSIVFSNCSFILTERCIKNKIAEIDNPPHFLLMSAEDKVKLKSILLEQKKQKIDESKRKCKRLYKKILLAEHRQYLERPRFKIFVKQILKRGLKIVTSPLLYLFPRKFNFIRKKFNSLDKASFPIDFGEVRDNYMQLKVNMDRMKDYDLANDFYNGEMEMKRLGEKWYTPKRWFLALYKTLSGYGNAPVRAVIMFFAMICIFSFPLFFMKLSIKDLSSQNKNQVSQKIVRLEPGFFGNFGEMASLSLYNMTALSNLTRSPYEPLDKWTFYYVSVVQYFIRPVQIALIILAIRRKVKRGEE